MYGITIVLCAWCGRYGRPFCGVRRPDSHTWQDVTFAEAQGLAGGGASHGVCAACQPRLAIEWGVERKAGR